MNLRLRSGSQLSAEEQRFLAEETTDKQVVQDQASAEAMVEAERAKAAEWAEVSGTVASGCPREGSARKSSKGPRRKQRRWQRSGTESPSSGHRLA